MDLKEIEWLLREKYGKDGSLEEESWSEEIVSDINRLKEGEPLAYVIGFVDFLDCKIDLRFRPLIPRPETEYWAELLIKNISNRNKPIHGLDIFSGSGCVGLALLRHPPNSQIDFVDNSLDCLAQIRLNLSLNKISPKRANVFQSNSFREIKDKYDLITANPPYIKTESFDSLPGSVKKYEPFSALIGGADGLKEIRFFLESVTEYLNKNGVFWLEFDPIQKDALTRIIDPRIDFHFGRDQYDQWRFLVGQKNFD
jgi:release factor glutamine methyltransferase